MTEFFAGIVNFACRRALLLSAFAILLGVLAGIYSASHFAMTSNTSELISRDLGWRQRQLAFDRAFPQQDKLILVVIDGATAERAEQGAAMLAAKLSADKTVFTSVRRPDAGAFFEQNGLLFLSPGEVKAATAQMVQAQPFLAALAADPSLCGVMRALTTALQGVEHGQAKLSDLQKPIAAFADTLGKVEANQPVFFSWRALLGRGKPSLRETRRFILVKPKLNYGALSPGGKATAALRATAASLHLTPQNGVRVRLSGEIPLSDEEFASLADHALLILALMIGGVLVMLWLALRSARIIAAILVTLFSGLAITTAFGLMATGALNLISVAFIPLFVGLGVDFGIQFAMRYRAERHRLNDLRGALVAAGGKIGAPLGLAATAIAAGFLAFVPTAYIGVANLGLIAGIGMIVAFVLSITVLPALLTLLKPRGEAEEIGYAQLAPLDVYFHRHRRGVLLAAGVLALIAMALLPYLRFDFNPLDLKNAHTESVSTLFDIIKDPQNAPNTINILAPNFDAAEKIGKQLSRLPEVGEVLTLKSFIPAQQAEKLASIADASMLLDPTINPFVTAPPPGDAEIAASLKQTSVALRHAAASAKGPAGADALRLADTLMHLATGPARLRRRAADVMIPPLNTMLTQMRNVLKAQPVTLKSLPPDLVRDWTAPDGRARLQLIPRGDSNDSSTMTRFTNAVLVQASNATGSAVSIVESGKTIERAFVQAGISSFLVVMVLLAIVLRRWRDVAVALASLLLAGVLTLATCVAIGMPINFANIIALPLLFGIGVAFNIYYLMAWRAGQGDLLQSALARAILFSALTTACGFGSLWLSSHPGTASMGELLMIALAWTVVTILLFLPAFLGPPRACA